jgi:pimeloyl-ACP methyl ester carboxylesterase
VEHRPLGPATVLDVVSTEAAPGTLVWPAQGRPRGSIGLLHGITSSAATWWRVGPGLATLGWDVTAIDLAGHGLGPRPEIPISLEVLVELALPALPPKMAVLVGHSLGAVVALAIANHQPSLADAILLEEPPGQAGIELDLLARGIAAEGMAVREDRAAYWRRVRQENPAWSDEDVERSVASVEAADTDAIARALAEDLGKWDLAGLARALSGPVMVIAAPPSDGKFPLVGATALRGKERAELQRLVPPERFVVLDGGHSLHREHPQRMVELISGFAGSVTA